MSKFKRINDIISKEKNLVKRNSFSKCHKMLGQVESLSKKHNFELTCLFGNDGWNTEYLHLNIQDTDNSLQSIVYALTALEFHRENILNIEDINNVVDQSINALLAYKEDKLNENKRNNN